MSRQENKKIIVSLPRLYDAGGDVKKQWFVYFTATDPLSEKNKRFRIYEGFSKYKTANAKRKHGKNLCQDYKEKLLNGWNPFERLGVVYENDLRYKLADEKFQILKKDKRDFEYFVNMFMQQKKSILRKSSEHTYRSKMRWFKYFLLKNNLLNQDVSGFTIDDAGKFNRFLFEDRNLSPKSVNAYNNILAELFEYINLILSGQNRQIDNVFKKTKRYKTTTKKPQVYNMSQIRKLSEIIEQNDKQMWLFIRLLFNCFIRPIEQRFLKIKHIDFVAGRIFIPGTISKNKKDNWVDVPQYVMDDFFTEGYQDYDPEYYVFSIKGKPWLKPVGKNYFYRKFAEYRDKAGLPKDMILYAFKHTGVAELKKSGADWLEIQNQLRHASLDQVIEYGYSLLGQSSKHIREKGPRI